MVSSLIYFPKKYLNNVCPQIHDSNPSRLLKNIQKVAFPLILLLSITSIPVVDGGRGSASWFFACILACESAAVRITAATAGAAASSLIACVNACVPLLSAPFCS